VQTRIGSDSYRDALHCREQAFLLALGSASGVLVDEPDVESPQAGLNMSPGNSLVTATGEVE
jgi:hypothetical protein